MRVSSLSTNVTLKEVVTVYFKSLVDALKLTNRSNYKQLILLKALTF